MNKSKLLAVVLLASCGGNDNSITPTRDAVQPAGAVGAVTLSWIIPTEQDDGTPLTDLAGFYIYFGGASGDYTDTIRIENPSINLYIVEGLTVGSTYYFAATSFNSLGVESVFSNEVSKTAH